MSMGFSRQETRVGCHALLQEIFLTQGLNPHPLHLLHCQPGSLPQAPPGKPSCLSQKQTQNEPQRTALQPHQPDMDAQLPVSASTGHWRAGVYLPKLCMFASATQIPSLKRQWVLHRYQKLRIEDTNLV